MHIGIVGPIATADIIHLLDCETTNLPLGYSGGPLLATLISELISRGHTVSAFTLSSDLPLNTKIAEATGNRFSLSYVPMRPRAWRPNGWLPGRIVDLYRFEINLLQQAIKVKKPDVLHAHWVYEFALAAIQTRLPHVITCHDSPYTIAKLNSTSRPTRSLYRWLRVLMARKTFRQAKYITAVSPYMSNEVQNLTSTPIHIVPNPVDDLALKAATSRLSNRKPEIVMVCNGWDTRKNPKPGLLAFNILLRDSPEATLHLYGNDFGPGQEADTWCKANGLGKGLNFHGSVPHKQLLASMEKHDLLLHTSIEESFGMVIAEAMAMGLPVVAGNKSGAVPWVVGKNGALCDVSDPEAIAAAMRATLAPARYAELSMNGIDAVRQRFSTVMVVDQFYALYEQAVLRKNSDAKNSGSTEVLV